MIFVHHFGSELNQYVHFHCCVIDGVFEPDQGSNEAVRFREAVLTDADVQWGELRPNVQWTFAARRTTGQEVRAGAYLIHRSRAKEGLHRLEWHNGGGFSIDSSVRIQADDRARALIESHTSGPYGILPPGP